MLPYLLLLADEKDRAEFEAFYINNKPVALRVASRFLGNPTLAENAVHDGFCAAAENFQKISGKSCQEQKAYLVKVVRNKSIDILRKEKKYMGMEEYSDDLTVPFDRVKAAEKLRETKADVSRAAEIILALPLIYRDVLECRLLLEMTNKEAAVALGISEDTCAQRYRRGRMMVAEALTKEGIHP